ncbi:MAG TPA: hypothetical protein VGI40_18920 [Pirellulaceae bacterium]|jgi:hypothetical protein
MSGDYFHHPFRFPGNAPGPFYTTGYQCPATSDKSARLVWCGNCLWCEAPEIEAPELLAPLNDDNLNTYFVRQPLTEEEIERACRALKVCCVCALRYGGKDITVIRKLNNDAELCDYTLDELGNLVLTADAETIIRIDAQNREWLAKQKRRWWEFWRWFS